MKDEYRQRILRDLNWYQKILYFTVWRAQWYIEWKIEKVKFKLYKHLFYWYDCFPPVELDDIPDYIKKKWREEC